MRPASSFGELGGGRAASLRRWCSLAGVISEASGESWMSLELEGRRERTDHDGLDNAAIQALADSLGAALELRPRCSLRVTLRTIRGVDDMLCGTEVLVPAVPYGKSLVCYPI